MNAPLLSITPPPENPDESDKEALMVIHELSNIMSQKSTIQTFLKRRVDAMGDDSVRRIQGGRYEIFVSDATDKPSTCFDQIVTRNRSLPLFTKDILVNYAIRQAKKNPNIANYGNDYKFENFSLLVNGRDAKQQPHHIDMVSPNSQFGLMLTSNSPGTLVYHVHDTIATVQDVKRIWNNWNGSNMLFLENLVTAFHSSNEATMLVQQFGNILIPEESMEEQSVRGDMPAGSLMTLPGGIIHAGPSSQEGRTVLFFSGGPSNEEQPPYHPDTQYSALFLCGQLVDVLWQSSGVGQEERKYLLRMLAKYQRQSSVPRKLACHFPEGGVKPFLMELEENENLLDETKLEEFIAKTAQSEMYCLYNVEGDFEMVSVEGLLTRWEGTELNVVVYRRPFDNKILLHYPTITEGSWEGVNPGETYLLVMNKDEMFPFDGSNGKLVDNDGDIILCYT